MAKKKKKVKVDKEADGVLGDIQKKYGKECAVILGKEEIIPCASISTGSISIDDAIGIGGIPQGRIVEIFGMEASGKTTIALHCVANAQKAGGRAAFIDAEHAIDPIYAEAIGVDLSALLFSQPDSGEQALDIVEMIVKANKHDIVVVDSVAALTPQAELDGEMGEQHVGRQARMMGQAMRKLAGIVKKSNTTLVFINQIRMKIGVMFGSPETTPGGNALKFYASVRIHLARIATLKDPKTEQPVGNKTRATIRKNKVGPPFKKVEFDILFGVGVNRPGEVLDIALEHKIISQSGSWFSYGEERIGQGRRQVCEFLRDNESSCAEIELKIEQAKELEETKEEATEKTEHEEEGNVDA